jgi:hypothetical protein
MASESSGKDMSALMQTLERQRDLYRRLRALTERQRGLVSQDDPQPLLALLGDRQKLVDELLSVNEQLAQYRRGWTEVYGRLDEPSRRRVTEMLEEANATLGLILNSDSRDSAMLSTRRQDLADRMSAVGEASRAGAAYAAARANVSSGLTDARA